ncbi:MAG: hypothetical protein H7Y22_02255 [Gemmatimonadaceae bacterium]|nr:hypothetical protein [Gloeobacterales cyanobacterium ES-bin-141]
MLEEILWKKQLLAIIVFNQFKAAGTHFFTPDEFSQQLAYMHHPAGKRIEPHLHNPVPCTIERTQEVLIIKRGELRVDFYNNEQQYLESRLLTDGDVILLVSGGHGFEVVSDVEMFEVKQGPYLGTQTKTCFSGVDAQRVQLGRALA